MGKVKLDVDALLRGDSLRLSALRAVAALELPDAWLAAGFIRNRVWDVLHGFSGTPLNDLDVIFFDSSDVDGGRAAQAEIALNERLPGQRWQVRNQALMHRRNGDRPYRDCADAMAFWPEIETAVGVRLAPDGQIDVLTPFGTDSLLAGRLTANPKRTRTLFLERVRSKRWLEIWPALVLADDWVVRSQTQLKSSA